MFEMLFSALFGGATGLVGTVIGKVFGWLEMRERAKTLAMEHAHEITLQRMQIEARGRELESELAIADTAAWSAGRVESYRHDMSAGESYRWVAAALRLTRPVLTLLLLVLTTWVFLRITDLGIQSDVVNQVIYLTAMAVAWWFGDRAPASKRMQGGA